MQLLESLELRLMQVQWLNNISNLITFAEHNAINHHTGKFELVSEHKVPVWRRGQTALITVTTTHPYNVKTHRMKITFDFG